MSKTEYLSERDMLIEKINNTVSDDIGFVKVLMDIVSQNIDEYLKKAKRNMEVKSSNAIHDLLSIAMQKKSVRTHEHAYAYYANAVYLMHQYGYSDGISSGAKETTDWFCDSYFPRRNTEWESMIGVNFDPLYEWWLNKTGEPK